jgi:hypothetical protein
MAKRMGSTPVSSASGAERTRRRARTNRRGASGSAAPRGADLEGARERAWLTALSFRDERERRIAQARTFTLEKASTLSALGQEFGITRERVRQLENAFRTRLEQEVKTEAACAPVLDLAADVRRQLGTIASQESVRRILWAVCPDGADAPMRRAWLIALAGPYTLTDGFWQRGGALAELRAGVAARAAGPFSERELVQMLGASGVSGGQRDACIAALPITLSGGGVLPADRSLGEHAVRILHLQGEPMSGTQLAAAVGGDVSVQAVVAHVRQDPRIRRVALHSYALAEWGEDAYSTVADELQLVIEERGGRANLAELAFELAESLGVAPASVRAQAATARFLRMADGTVTVRDHCDSLLKGPAVCPGLDRDLVRGREGWAVRVSVEEQILRGSARPLRTAIPRAARVAPGEARTITLRNGSVEITWRCKRPAIASTRPLVQALGCADGDRVFVPLLDGASAFAVAGHEIGAAAGVARVALEVGLPAGAPISRIAHAIGLSRGASAQQVVERLQARGQHELANLVASR